MLGPELFGDVGQEWVEQAKQGAMDRESDQKGRVAGRPVVPPQAGLDRLQIPVTELVPETGISRIGRIVEPARLHLPLDPASGFGKAMQHPEVFELQ